MINEFFMNPAEGRLRAVWRILIQGIIFIVGVLLTNILLGLFLGILLVASGGSPQDQGAILALSRLPIARVISPLGALLSMFLSYWVAARWLDHRPFRTFGFHFGPRWWLDLGFGLVLGAALMIFIFAVERSAGWVTVTGTMQSRNPGLDFWTGIAANLFAYICVGIYEEMLSRGYQLRNLAEGLNFKPFNPRIALLLAYLISSSIFGLLHLANDNSSLVSTLNLIAAGLFLGLAYVLTGELAIPIGLHITWNFFQGNVFGFPVSGGPSEVSFIAIQQGGPDIWTGGAFGPEAGLIGLIALALGCALIALWVRWQHGQVRLDEKLAIYKYSQKMTAAASVGSPEAAQTTLGESL